jgi:hypothetical protein
MDEELCACIIDWQQAFDRVNWTKLMQIVIASGNNWCKGKLIRKFYMVQSVDV